ncbi:MAG: FkbM family methyltransferase [Candidatus Nanohaloarchaea archaeon]|jgi:FkbM family methyltransferase
MTLSSRVLGLFKKVGMGKTVRECYKHSIYRELYYRLETQNKQFLKVQREIEDSSMILDATNIGLEKDLFLQNIREAESTKIFRSEIEEGDAIADIGSNIGYYTLMAAKEAGNSGKVFSIEPDPETYQRLNENIELNDYSNIKTLNKAIGSSRKKEYFTRSKITNTRHIHYEGEEKDLEVEVQSLDNVIEENIDVVRMDVEGYEHNILKGMKNTLSENNVKLFLEMHPRKIKFYDSSLEDLMSFLSRYDFKVKYLVRHSMKGNPSQFIRLSHPKREVLEVNQSIENTLDNHQSFFRFNKPFRVFLEN